ncbi:hypothetical protein HYFRA_00012213 [Hymenoscyphus fraxineus]|uniref:BTB domain-containing protein n=1 Tax=Hymenoscyphus fraxineus TaxID=746836 RepID=A0A9N9KZD8_9HELO|nr:hypothetical protein HYFRA_00012213 [Hymenoscyphus fraxineus]
MASLKSSNPTPSKGPPPPIAFDAPFPNLGAPDVRINVYGQDFHLHSTILKLNSKFLSGILDDADRLGVGPVGRFKYDYTFTISDDGGCGIVLTAQVVAERRAGTTGLNSNNGLKYARIDIPQALRVGQHANHQKDQPPPPYQEFESNKNKSSGGATVNTNQQTSSDILQQTKDMARGSTHVFSAIYNKDFAITSVEEILDAIRVANYLQIKPLFSKALDRVFRRRPERTSDGQEIQFADLITKAPFIMLLVAKHLHNRVLFNDALVHSVATWPSIKKQFENADAEDMKLVGDLMKTTLAGYEKLQGKVVSAMQIVLKACGEKDGVCEHLRACADSLNEKSPVTSNAHYYRQILNRLEKNLDDHQKHQNCGFKNAKRALEGLLKSNLKIGDKAFHNRTRAGVGAYQRKFLCAEIYDKDLPWDVNEQSQEQEPCF